MFDPRSARTWVLLKSTEPLLKCPSEVVHIFLKKMMLKNLVIKLEFNLF